MHNKLINAGLGSIMGALVGDAAGAYLEFLGRAPSDQEIDRAMSLPGGGTWNVAHGQITDDGELTLCLAQALLESRGFDIETVARWYAKWFASPPFDIGNTTRSSIGCVMHMDVETLTRNKQFAESMTRAAAAKCRGSMANGSLMRISPLGAWGHSLPNAELARLAGLDSSLSHPNETCCHAVGAYCIAIAELVRH
ncbi:MAG TPA: ADP-ribosylglycohydrolase family protein, partial [Candidatus Ozemobacteraceae bacterium]|nr:ADP-ribosylglycohydrolase family protein [Candidatus Ozemobacteraceae bacterium]